MANWIGAKVDAISVTTPRIVELACGAGYLASFLQGHLPAIHYCGFDLSPHLLDHARRRLDAARGSQPDDVQMEFYCADLVRDDWTKKLLGMGWIGKVDAVISIQALHDLGGLEQQAQVLKQAREMLRNGGLLAYGDLLQDAENPHPSRYNTDQHLQMLSECGYSLRDDLSADRDLVQPQTDQSAAVRFGAFGCFAGYI
ncbi:MAG: class I SAM-dependent methyltransferase [Caldilineaceae bacterium]|nr:class I SAM-dependent methyltransferase [Caldilineaceae bacterium]